MGFIQSNNAKINNAFSRIKREKDMVIEAGMRDLLEDAMLYALGEHDTNHWFHRSTENSYGWCIVHNGKGVAFKVNEGRHGGGNAYEQLMAASREVSQTGWVGILLASFRVGDDAPRGNTVVGPRMFYFNVDYEMTVLSNTADNVQRQFQRFFKPLASLA